MKKIFTMIVTIAIVFNMVNIHITAATEEETYAGNQLRILGVLRGYSDGTLKLDNSIVRAEVAALTVRILGYENALVVGKEKDFTDVKTNFWAFNDIQNAFKLGVISGYPTGEFKPQNNITYAEVITIMVNALGENKDLVGTWPTNYLDKGKALGIIPVNSTVSPSKIVTRGEMAVIIWNTLLVEK